MLQPQSQGGSFSEDVHSKRRKRIFERNGVFVLPCWVVKQTAQKRLAEETNMDVRVEESGLVIVEEFGPTSADEDVVQKAE